VAPQGIYDMHVQLMGLPVLPWAPPPLSHNVSARQIMSAPVRVLHTVERVSTVLHVLESCLHQGFPVVDDRFADLGATGGVGRLQARPRTYGTLRGLVLRSQLKVGPEFDFLSQLNVSLRSRQKQRTIRLLICRFYL